MDFSILPKPVHPSEKLKRLTNLHINQQLHFKKELDAKKVPELLATERNRVQAKHEIQNLINDKMRIQNALGKGSLPYQNYKKEHGKRYDELIKIISN